MDSKAMQGAGARLGARLLLIQLFCVGRFLLIECLSLTLLVGEEVAQPGQGLRGDDQSGRDHRLATSDVSITPALLVLGTVSAEDVVFALADELERPVGVVDDGALDLLRLFLHHGEGLIDLGEALISQRVGLGHVWCDVAVRLGEVREARFGEGLVS